MKTLLYAIISRMLNGKSPKHFHPLPSDINEVKELYFKGKHKEVACILPHIRDVNDTFVKRLAASRLLIMGEDLKELKAITLGADPEFILKDEKGGVVLFSSDYIREHMGINMSQASLGADYGLLEIRPQETITVGDLLKNIKEILDRFDELYKNIFIKETEAVILDHKKERLRHLINNSEIDFGESIQKFNSVNVADVCIDDEMSYMNMSLSAYDEPLMFPQRDDLLTAGGHIHVGGTFVRMLSLEQLKGLIRKIDEKVYPMCISVETSAGEMRREVYGNRGEFRIKPYGVEYRTPSNAIFWPKNVKVLEEILKEIYDITINFLL